MQKRLEGLTDALAEFAASLTYDRLPAEVVETTKLYLADYFAACFAGCRVNETYNRAVEALVFGMEAKGEASVLFSDQRLPVGYAAYLMATYAHGADMDDGNRKAMGHVGAHVMSTVLAMGEFLPHATGKDLLCAMTVGYEVYNRVAAAAQPGLVRRGFHSTGTAGTIACAAAAAKLLKLPKERIAAAMGLAAVQASGLILIAESGQSCKPVNPANAARAGIFSALMAEKGVDCPRSPLESDKGWLHAMTDAPDPEQITKGLGQIYTVTESYLKPYPSCRHTHCGIECALGIRQRMLDENKSVRAADVKAIRVAIYENAIRIAGQIRLPVTKDESKFSIHATLATAFLTGRFGISDLEPTQNSDVADLIAKTELLPDADMENRDAGIRGCRMTVELTDGTCYEQTVLIPKGDAANPFTWEDLRVKLADCAEGLLSTHRQNELLATVKQLETLKRFPSVRELVDH